MNMTAVEFFADQAMRTEVYDAVQGAFADCDIIVTPTLACLPVKNLTNGETIGPERVNGEEVDRLIGWCLTYPLNFTGNPAASIPAGLSKSGLPVACRSSAAAMQTSTSSPPAPHFERARAPGRRPTTSARRERHDIHAGRTGCEFDAVEPAQSTRTVLETFAQHCPTDIEAET